MLEAKVCNVSHSSIPILKAKLEAVWAHIPAEVDCTSSAKVDKQLWAIESKRGGYIENSFNKSYFILSKEVMFKFSIIFIKN